MIKTIDRYQLNMVSGGIYYNDLRKLMRRAGILALQSMYCLGLLTLPKIDACWLTKVGIGAWCAFGVLGTSIESAHSLKELYNIGNNRDSLALPILTGQFILWGTVVHLANKASASRKNSTTNCTAST